MQLATTDDLDVVILDPNDPERRMVFRGHEECSPYLAFSPNSELLVSSGDDVTVRIWRLPDEFIDGRVDEEPVFVLEGHERGIICVAFAADSSVLASGSFDGTVRFWSMTDGSQIQIVEDPDGHRIESIGFSSDSTSDGGGFLAIGGVSAFIRIVGGRLWQDVLEKIELINGPVANSISLSGSASYSPQSGLSGSVLFAEGRMDSYHAILYSFDTKERTRLLPESKCIGCLAFSPDSSLIIVCENVNVHILNSSDLTTLRVLATECSWITSAVLSADNTLLALIDDECQLAITDAITGEILYCPLLAYSGSAVFRPQTVILL
jgi:WD40 repeat protein